MIVSLAQSAETVTRSVVWQWPTSPAAWAGWSAAFVAATVLVFLVYRRDARDLPAAVRGLLVSLRVAALGTLAVIALNPQERTQREAFRPSQVAVLVDTSTSMQQPSIDRDEANPDPPSRSDVVRGLLAETPLLRRLRESHAVNVFTFDAALAEQPVPLATTGQGRPAATEERTQETAAQTPDWAELTRPRGGESRLGDAVDRVIAESDPRALAGVVVLSDGALNAGRDVRPANARARSEAVKVFGVGVGGTAPPVNIRLARVIVPTDVQAGDRFDIGVLLQGQGVEGRSATLEIVRRTTDAGDETIFEETVTLPADGQVLQVDAEDRRTAEGEVEYVARVRPAGGGTLESRDDDNERSRKVRVFDRPLEVLVFAGGPTRDYRFARNALFRHPSSEVDVFLQTGRPGLSQDARDVVFDFPEAREDLFRYDVLVAFDPDWSALSDEQMTWLTEWIAEEGGGLIFVAGEVFAPRIATGEEQFAPVRTLLPVSLEPLRPLASSRRRRESAYRVDLTEEGRAAEFLAIDDAGGNVWDTFPGVFATYPVDRIKAGATVYATYGDPAAVGPVGPPPVFAEQRYGQGTVFFIGTSELWRLRAEDEEWYERLWVKLVRRAAQARSKLGLGRGLLLLDGLDVPLGQSAALRAKVLDPQFRPLQQDDLPLSVTGPDGRPVVPPVVLARDRTRPAEYAGEFRPPQPGTYRVRLRVPDSDEVAEGEIRVDLPQLEASSGVQDVAVLRRLSEDTGGRYLTPAEAVDILVEELPAAGQTVLVDRTLRPLWDRMWVLGLLIGCLGVEWLIRKLAKLA